MTRLSILLVPALCFTLGAACASVEDDREITVVDVAGPLQTERTPVPEGINDGFLARNLDVDAFVARWELESREVYLAREDIVTALALRPGETVADVGAGTGLFASLLSREVGSGGRVIAVDIAPNFVEHIERRIEAEDLGNVEAHLSTERSAELPASAVDAILLSDVYHHFEYHEDMLRSLVSALRPGGRLVVVDFERIPGTSREWILGHVRAGKEVVTGEVEGAGFALAREVPIEAFEENYCLVFEKPRD